MKTFKEVTQANQDKGFTINDKGEAIPDAPIHFKKIASDKKKVKVKNEIKEALTHVEELPGQHKLHQTPNPHKPGSDAHYKEIGKRMSAQAEHHQKISDTLHSKQTPPTKVEKKHLSDYTEGEEGSGTHSYNLNQVLIHNHKKGNPPTTGMTGHEKALHHTMTKLTSKPLGHEVHLYSGVGFNPKAAAKKSKEGVIHLPAHISMSHHSEIATGFANINHDLENTGRHVIHVHAKASDKGYHIGKYSNAHAEHETVLPAGTKLKYSHSTAHKDDEGNKINIHHFTVHSQ
jgi:hypothetical protein